MSKEKVTANQKLIGVLRVLGMADSGMLPLKEIVRLTGINSSTCLAVLKSLVDEGWVGKVENGFYFLKLEFFNDIKVAFLGTVSEALKGEM